MVSGTRKVLTVAILAIALSQQGMTSAGAVHATTGENSGVAGWVATSRTDQGGLAYSSSGRCEYSTATGGGGTLSVSLSGLAVAQNAPNPAAASSIQCILRRADGTAVLWGYGEGAGAATMNKTGTVSASDAPLTICAYASANLLLGSTGNNPASGCVAA